MRASHGSARWVVPWLALLLAAGAATARAQVVEVAVVVAGDKVIVDVSTEVPFRREIVWAVLTDYEHMASYVGNLKTSTVLSRQGDLLQVEQSGEARRAFLSFSFQTVRTIELSPEREIRSRLVRGDFKSYEFSTRLTGEAGGPIRILNHGEYVPNRWVPPVVGPALIESETRKQYADLIAEMRRRASVGK